MKDRMFEVGGLLVSVSYNAWSDGVREGYRLIQWTYKVDIATDDTLDMLSKILRHSAILYACSMDSSRVAT